MSNAKETEFKGMPLLALSRNEDDNFPFQFGLRRAGLILKHVEDIRNFYEKHSQKANV